jgi:hypothetical protein
LQAGSFFAGVPGGTARKSDKGCRKRWNRMCVDNLRIGYKETILKTLFPIIAYMLEIYNYQPECTDFITQSAVKQQKGKNFVKIVC